MKTVLNYGDIVFVCLFFVEFLIKVVGLGAFYPKRAYFRDIWHIIDFIVLLVRQQSLLPSCGLIRCSLLCAVECSVDAGESHWRRRECTASH